MIFYPLSLLMLGGIREILIISTPRDLPHFQALFGDGSQYGISLSYISQEQPKGIPEAFLLGEKFIGNDDVTLILGDNLFYGDISFYRETLTSHQKRENKKSAYIFGYHVSQPERYGVIEFEKQTGKVLGVEEKPKNPKSKFAIPGLYVFDNTVVNRAKNLKPSTRGETEIIDVIRSYLSEDNLGVRFITRGVAWLDTGTPKSLLEASAYIAALEERQSLKVACLEEIAVRMGFISKAKFIDEVERLPNSEYKDYLKTLSEEV